MDPLDELMARCSLRDQRAFAELYRRTSGRLLAVAMRIVRRRDWAEEILQESFVSIWHHVPQYDRVRSAPMTWMTTIVRNRALDWVRRPQHETSDEGLEHVVENWADDAPGPLDLLGMASQKRELSACMDKLTPPQRQSVALAFFDGLSHAEVAAQLQEPLGTVKSWVRRALNTLKGCLDRAVDREVSANSKGAV